MRPTGKLHLGHYVGALESWVALQGEYENFHLVADNHVLTTQSDTSAILDNTIEMVKDWIAAGIDPSRSPIFRQSQVKEHAELFLLLSMLVTVARLTPWKGVDRVLKVFRDLPGEPLYHILGDGPERQSLEALARDRGVEDRVHFEGAVDRHRVGTVLRAADQ